MPLGTASKSQSVLNFRSHSRIEADTNAESEMTTQRKKRPRVTEDYTETPTILINGDESTLDPPFNSASNITVLNNEQTNLQEGNLKIVKLNCLRDKADRYESHISILNNCLEFKRIPNGLVIDLEPSIGNNDEAFRAKWYQRLEEFSLTLMSDIVVYSEKIKEETSAKIETEQESFNNYLNGDGYKEVSEVLNKNSANRKHLLKQNIRKKFHHLKYNRASPTHKPFQIINGQERPSPITVAPRDNRRRNDNRSTHTNNYKPQEKTWSSLFRNNSGTNLRNVNMKSHNHDNNNETIVGESNGNSNFHDNSHRSKTDRQIRELRNEITAIKATKQINTNSKNEKPAPPRGRDNSQQHGTLQNKSTPDAEQVMAFINATMLTLTTFKKQFEKQQPIGRTL